MRRVELAIASKEYSVYTGRLIDRPVSERLQPAFRIRHRCFAVVLSCFPEKSTDSTTPYLGIQADLRWKQMPQAGLYEILAILATTTAVANLQMRLQSKYTFAVDSIHFFHIQPLITLPNCKKRSGLDWQLHLHLYTSTTSIINPQTQPNNVLPKAREGLRW